MEIYPISSSDVLAGRIVIYRSTWGRSTFNALTADFYRYINFDQIPEFVEQAATVEM